jgi:hypothetical protein
MKVYPNVQLKLIPGAESTDLHWISHPADFYAVLQVMLKGL